MKRKNKGSKLTAMEEIYLRRYLCKRMQKRGVCCAAYLLASDVFKRDDLKEILLDKAIKKHMDSHPTVSEHAIVAFSTYDMSNLDNWVALRYHESMAASGYLLDTNIAEEALIPMRKEYLALKKCLQNSEYRVTPDMVPTAIEIHAKEIELYSTPLGKVIFWNAWNWILVTDIEYEIYMQDVRENLFKIDLKRNKKSMLAMNLGSDFDQAFPDDSSEGTSAREFFTPEVLTWTQNKIIELKKGIRLKKKLML